MRGGRGRERTREEEKREKKKREEKKGNCERERRRKETGGGGGGGSLASGTTRPVSKTRRAKPEGKGGRETLLPKIYGATGNTRTLLVTSWWTPRARTGLSLSIYIYRMIQKHRVYFHLPSSRPRCLCPVHRSPVSFLCFSPADEARKLPEGMRPPPLCPRLPTLLLLLLVLHRSP